MHLYPHARTKGIWGGTAPEVKLHKCRYFQLMNLANFREVHTSNLGSDIKRGPPRERGMLLLNTWEWEGMSQNEVEKMTDRPVWNMCVVCGPLDNGRVISRIWLFVAKTAVNGAVMRGQRQPQRLFESHPESRKYFGTVQFSEKSANLSRSTVLKIFQMGYV